jgi:hypothetical protein
MECLCLRLHRATFDHTLVYSDHAIMNPDDVVCDDETKDSSVRYEWWASSMLRHAGKNHTTLMAKNLMAGGHDHIGSWLPDLSLPARRFLETNDICAIEELFVRHEPCAGSIPRGWRTEVTDKANWSPLPWLNLPYLCEGGTEIHTAITDLLSQRGGIGGADGLRGIQKTIPIVREQMYQLSASQYFRVAGILPDGSISGWHFSPVSLGRAKNPRAVYLQLDPDCPSEAQGSGFSSTVSCSALQATSFRRVIMSSDKGY